jgi:hypothetical protein
MFVMLDPQRFIVTNHDKIIEHYRWLLETSVSDEERDRYRLEIEAHEEALQRTLNGRPNI